MKYNLKIFLLMVCVLGLAACNGPSMPQEAKYAKGEQGTQVLLDAEDGAWEVESERPKDPLQAHLWARQQVDPSDRKTSHVYTTKNEPEAVDEKQYARVMKLRPGTVKLKQQHSQHNQVFKAPVPAAKPFVQKEGVVNVVQKPDVKPEFKPVRGLKVDTSHSANLVNSAHEIASKDNAGGIENIRIGEHPGKTRLVFDADSPVSFSYDFEKGNKVLQIDFQTSSWRADKERDFFDHRILEHYEVRKSGKKTRFVLNLKKPARVLFSKKYKPNDVYGYHRIVIDISTL